MERTNIFMFMPSHRITIARVPIAGGRQIIDRQIMGRQSFDHQFVIFDL